MDVSIPRGQGPCLLVTCPGVPGVDGAEERLSLLPVLLLWGRREALDTVQLSLEMGAPLAPGYASPWASAAQRVLRSPGLHQRGPRTQGAGSSPPPPVPPKGTPEELDPRRDSDRRPWHRLCGPGRRSGCPVCWGPAGTILELGVKHLPSRQRGGGGGGREEDGMRVPLRPRCTGRRLCGDLIQESGKERPCFQIWAA